MTGYGREKGDYKQIYMRSIRELKRGARQALNGKMGTAIGATVAVGALSFVGSMISGQLFPGITLLDIILNQLFLTILMLIFSVFSAGLSYMYLNMARGREFSFGNLIHFFKNHPDRIITATIVLAVLDLLSSIPLNCYIYMVEPGTNAPEVVGWMTSYAVLMLVTTVLSILLSIPFSMMYYLLADNPEMTGFEAIKASMRLMKGKIGKYLLMQISFFPLLLLSIFTLYIALLWIVPYIQTTSVMFYRDAIGELDRTQEVQEPFGAAELAARLETQKDDQSEA